LLRTSPASGRPGCVGFSVGAQEWAFPYEAPSKRVVHLCFVSTPAKPVSEVTLFADGALVGRGEASAPMPLGYLGDPRLAFRGLLLKARFWRASLSAEDAARGAAGGASARLAQSREDLVADWEVGGGGGCVLFDHAGGPPALVTGCSWEEAPEAPEAFAAEAAPLQLPPLPPAGSVTVTGVWSRTLGAGEAPRADRWGPSEVEPVTLTYWRKGGGNGGGGGGGGGVGGAADVVEMEGELKWCDAALAARVEGTVKGGGEVEFKCAPCGFTERGRSCVVDSAGGLAHAWLASARFTGRVSGNTLTVRGENAGCGIWERGC